MWKCLKCNEELEDQFEICWNCSHDKSGNIGMKMGDDKEFNVYESPAKQQKTQPVLIKQTNEYGIAGFVFSSILMVHEGFLKLLGHDGYFDQKMIGVGVAIILFSTSLFASIKGCLKDGQLYQKGLANIGLIFNIILFTLIVYTFLQGFSTGGGGRGTDEFEWEIIEDENSSQNNSLENEKSTICSVCGNSFKGNGYEEQIDGSWKELSANYQGTICSPTCGRKNNKKLNDAVRSYKESNSTNNGDYRIGNDGRVYEKNACGLCKGTGIETGRNIVTGVQEGRICPMCDGKGVRSY